MKKPEIHRIVSVPVTRRNNGYVEVLLWAVIAGLILGGYFVDLYFRPFEPVEALANHYFEFVLAFLVLLFPLVYKLVFGRLPLESMRHRRQLSTTPIPAREVTPTAQVRTDFESGSPALETFTTLKLLAAYASSSKRLSEGIYNRAGVYLLVGVLVAFSGLVFFYLQTAGHVYTGLKGMSVLLMLGPRFGILFFIELVAFFFLRQYRSAMDEFRYFEAVKRNREETLAFIRLTSEAQKPLDPMELVKNNCFFSKAGILSEGQTSEIIESRKLEKNELDLLEKVVDAVSKGKGG